MNRRSVFWAVLTAVVCAGLFITHSAALSITTAALSFPNVSLNGYDQFVSGSTSPWQVDANGEAGGWHATIAASDFGNGAGGVIPVGNLSFRLLDANISYLSGDPILPFSTQTSFIALSESPITFLSAANGTSDGSYLLSPEFNLTVPAETYVGSYTTTITISITSGP